MKEILKYILLGILLSACMVLGYVIAKHNPTPPEVITDIITVTDTVTNWQADTVYLKRYDTVKLVQLDTVNDTLLKLDSVLVEVPISQHVFDTTIIDTNFETHLKAVISGFHVSLDSIYLDTKIMQQQPSLTPKNKHWGIGAGLMYGTGGFGVGVGVMYNLF